MIHNSRFILDTSHRKIIRIEFFPDYMSTGIWVTYLGDDFHQGIEPSDLALDLPQWFLNKINAMNLAWDMFAISCSEKEYQYDIWPTDLGYGYMSYIICTDFTRLYPEYAHFVDFRKDLYPNIYNIATTT